MKFHVQLNLGGDGNFAYASSKVNNDNYGFMNIENIETSALTPLNYDELVIEWDSHEEAYAFKPYLNDTLIGTYYGYDAIEALGAVITFDCEPSYSFYQDAIKLEDEWYIDMGGHDLNGVTNILTYKLNDERDAVNKSLIVLASLTGNFKAPISIKNIELDIVDYAMDDFNYVYIPKLHRFYYVSNVQFTTNEYTRLLLQEDVLMSWQSLIKQQNAFITRYENADNNSLVDTRLPLEDKLTNLELTLTDSTVSLVNCTFKFDITTYNNVPNIMIISFSTTQNIPRDTQTYNAPVGLPNQSSQFNTREWANFIKLDVLKDFVNAYLTDDTVSSFFETILWLPFDCTNLFDLQHTNGMALYVKNKYIDNTGVYRDDDDDTHTPMTTYQSRLGSTSKHVNGVCPYIIIADFTYVLPTLKFYDREPYANYEFFIPFVGWIKVEAEKFINKRILVYYSMDLKTGIATAYIYNYTEQYIIWSGNCQLGIKIDLTTTNQLENIRQKQANDLNMILGLISSAVAIGIGAVSENPVAIVGGVLSASKTIASNVNANNQIFERASMSFGSANGSLYTKETVSIRKIYHEPLSITNSVYKKLEGLPYNKYGALSSLTGYIEIGDIHFDAKGENIYNVEIDEIVALLKGGVIL